MAGLVSLIATRYPVLYHMAAAGSWHSIAEHGLLSTSALLDLFEIEGETRRAIELRHRPESVVITHPAYGRAVVRDQKPMENRGLERALSDDLTPGDWYQLLNRFVFFWLTEERLSRMINAAAYRSHRHTILRVASNELLAAHSEHVVLSPINSGCTKPFPHPRGKSSFLGLEEYPFEHWDRKRRKKDPIVELAVRYGISDIERYVISVDEVGGDAPPRRIYER